MSEAVFARLVADLLRGLVEQFLRAEHLPVHRDGFLAN